MKKNLFTVQLPFLIEKIYLKKKETTVFFSNSAFRIQVCFVCLFVCRSPLISCYLKIYSRHQEPWLLPSLKPLTSFCHFLGTHQSCQNVPETCFCQRGNSRTKLEGGFQPQIMFHFRQNGCFLAQPCKGEVGGLSDKREAH